MYSRFSTVDRYAAAMLPRVKHTEDDDYEAFRRADEAACREDTAPAASSDEDVEYDNLGRTELPKRAAYPARRYVDEDDYDDAPQLAKFDLSTLPATPWSVDASNKIAAEIAAFAPDSEDELIMDEIDIITGVRSPQPLRINTEIQACAIHVIERETPQDPVLERKKIMTSAYEQNGKLFGGYFRTRVTLTIDNAPPKKKAAVRTVKRVEKKAPKRVVPQPEKAPEIEPVTDKTAILRFCRETAAAEAAEAAEKIAENAETVTTDAPAKIEREPEVSAEVRGRVEARIAAIKAAIATRAAKTRVRTVETTEPVRAVKPARQERRSEIKQLTAELFYNNSKVAELDTRMTLAMVHDPTTLMTLVGMITKRPEEIVKCRDDPEYMVPLPPLAANSGVMVASPTQANVILTPPIIASLCRNGNDCPWYRRQAYLVYGVEPPSYLQQATECHFMHVARDPLTIEMPTAKSTETVRFVQCSIQGCTQQQHYTPYDDASTRVIHMTTMHENCPCNHCRGDGHHCIHDGRNFCQNALVEGCCRRHHFAGPVLATIMMRALLNFANTDPYRWPVTDYSALSALWRQLVSIKVPGTDKDMGDRFRMKGIWPAEKKGKSTGHRH